MLNVNAGKIYTGAQLGGEGGWGLSCPFLRIKQSAMIFFGGECPGCVYPWVKFAIQNVVL